MLFALSAEQIGTIFVAPAAVAVTLIINRYFDGQREARSDAKEADRHRWDTEDRQAKQAEMVGKIDENTQISVKAFDTANHVNEKIVDVAAMADRNAVMSMATVSATLVEHGKAIDAIKATGEETRRMIQVRIGDQLAPRQ